MEEKMTQNLFGDAFLVLYPHHFLSTPYFNAAEAYGALNLCIELLYRKFSSSFDKEMFKSIDRMGSIFSKYRGYLPQICV